MEFNEILVSILREKNVTIYILVPPNTFFCNIHTDCDFSIVIVYTVADMTLKNVFCMF